MMPSTPRARSRSTETASLIVHHVDRLFGRRCVLPPRSTGRRRQGRPSVRGPGRPRRTLQEGRPYWSHPPELSRGNRPGRREVGRKCAKRIGRRVQMNATMTIVGTPESRQVVGPATPPRTAPRWGAVCLMSRLRTTPGNRSSTSRRVAIVRIAGPPSSAPVGIVGLGTTRRDIGTRNEPVREVEQLRSSARVKLAMFPLARCRRGQGGVQWQTTSSPSNVACTSSSIPVAPAANAT